MKTKLLFILLFLVGSATSYKCNAENINHSNSLLVEAENFDNKGGWVVDQQFMDNMGSSYLMAHGMGKPVKDASTKIIFPNVGKYYVYARTFNWTSVWSKKRGAGRFKIKVGTTTLPNELGCEGDNWDWQYAGEINIKSHNSLLELKDMTGFNGRCDAIYFTQNKDNLPPNDIAHLYSFRKEMLALPRVAPSAGNYDLVVVGAGVAGMCAAMSAARLGCKVALINDRPVLGGNNSSEIRVHLGGRINIGPYKSLGNMIKEFGPSKEGNAKPKENYEDEKKSEWIASEKNIELFSSMHVDSVEKNGELITKVIARNIETNKELSFSAPLFVDCTGDGTVGYLAKADYRMGRESKEEFNEKRAPEIQDNMTMGASCQWYSEKTNKKTSFPLFEYGVNFTPESCQKVTMGEWTWETGMNKNQITDAEQIRDYGLMIIYSNWSFLKNRLKNNNIYQNRNLGWVEYIEGKRESRRLLGDYILTGEDITHQLIHEDATLATTWSIDLHYPDPENSKYFKGGEFKSIARHTQFYPYPIPFRCLYSRNVNNLFMAGRDISVTHVALGTVRVMRTCGMMGEVVGMAANLCRKYKALPRDIYRNHFSEMKVLMNKGTGKENMQNNQNYNLGGTVNTPIETTDKVLYENKKGKTYEHITTIITRTTQE